MDKFLLELSIQHRFPQVSRGGRIREAKGGGKMDGYTFLGAVALFGIGGLFGYFYGKIKTEKLYKGKL